ncbi:MAG: SGNH/GDSL hydrolase family protein [Gammaproteobacteria bacterium]|nr:SGNH/GDSL hydrolase family protein [Gammaproteobacteria bacterium]MDD9960406.1 SGNH/GDSL hydrolase family protein [Gammaproteobacteria bacterium]
MNLKSLLFTRNTFVVFLVLASFSLAVSGQEHSDPRWITSWTTSPSTLPPTESGYDSLNNQTLRLVVHTSVGGSALRIRLANYHGDQSISVGDVSIAIQAEGSAIQGNTVFPLTFNGEDSISISRGAVVFSDPLLVEVPELTNLSLSIYLPEQTGFLTAHALSNQTNYVSEPGNHTESISFPVQEETPAWNLLTAIDVINDDPLTAIATVGDSITDGWGSTDSDNQRWPNHFARRIFSDPSIPKFAVVNAGISGNRVTTEANPQFGQNLQARFERDVLALNKVTHMVLLEGINDIGMATMETGSPISADRIISGYRNIIARAQTRGIKIIGATLTPFENAVYYSEEGEAQRQAVNNFIRNSGEFDGVIDFDAVIRDPDNPKRIIPSFTEDNLHPNDAGYKAMADSIDLDLFR